MLSGFGTLFALVFLLSCFPATFFSSLSFVDSHPILHKHFIHQIQGEDGSAVYAVSGGGLAIFNADGKSGYDLLIGYCEKDACYFLEVSQATQENIENDIITTKHNMHERGGELSFHQVIPSIMRSQH